MAANQNTLGVKLQRDVKAPRPLHATTINNPSNFNEIRSDSIREFKSIVHGNQKKNSQIPYTGLSNYNPSYLKHGSQQSTTPALRRPRLSAYKSTSVTMHTEYDVLVCNIENGPGLFSIQLKSSLDLLKKMMLDLETIPLVPLNIFELGTPCLARYSYDNCLYRAVITQIHTNECSVAYIDYGHSEKVPSQNMYVIPEHFLEHNTFSIKFSLTGCKNLELTPQVKTRFRDLVLLQEVKLKVTPLDGPPFYQYCELYLNGKNVLEILQNSFTTQVRYIEPLPLVNNEMVIVRYINSPRDFFVQKLGTLKIFENMMDDLNNYCKELARPLQFFKKGLPCALYFDNHYYRGEILSDFTHGEAVQVLHVDFGYTHMIEKKNVFAAPPEITRMPKQAVHCVLKGFEEEDSIIRESVVTQFEMLSEKTSGDRSEFYITVFREYQNGTYLVNLKNAEGLDLMKKLYKLSQPFNKYIDLEKKEQQQQLQMNSTSTSNDINDTLESGNNAQRNQNGPNRIVREPINANARVAFESRNSSIVSEEKSADIRQRQQTPFRDVDNNNVVEIRKLVPSVQDRLNVGRDANYNHHNSQPAMFEANNQNGHQNYHKTQSRSAMPTITIEDSVVEEYVSFDTPFNIHHDIELNKCQSICISWWFSPFQFYVYFKDTKQQFDDLTKQLAEFYSKKAPIAKFLKKDSSFVICYSVGHKTFYRAKIIATNAILQKYKVFLVDVGTTITISVQDVFEVEKRFTVLPQLVTLCSLRGIISNMDHNKSVEYLTPYVSPKNSVTCKFLHYDEKNQLHVVELLSNGTSVIEEMSRKGCWSIIGNNVDFDFLKLQQIRATIMSVDSMLQFKIKIEGFDFPLMCSYADFNYVKANPGKEKDFKEYYENKSFVLNVSHVTADKVILMEPLSKLFHPDDPTFICRYPLIHNDIIVRVAHVEDYNQVFVHLHENEDKIIKFNDDLFDYYETKGKSILAVKEGQICAAKSSDENWYRAKVTKIYPTTDKVQVFYFDFGNFEDVEKTNIKHIENEFCSFSSALAIKLMLPIGDKQENEKTVILNEIKSRTYNCVVKARIIECYVNVFIADIYTDNYSMIDVLKGKGLMKEPDMQHTYTQINSDPVQFYEFIETVDLTKDEDDPVVPIATPAPEGIVNEPISILKVEVLNSRVEEIPPAHPPEAVPQPEVINLHADKTEAFLSHCDSPGKFYLQLGIHLNELHQLQENLQIIAGSLPPLMRVFNGANCICKCSVHQQWFRAKIIDSELLVVQLIDFGSTDALTECDIKDIKEPVKTDREPFCLEYSLPIIPKGTIDWCDEANKIFNDSFNKPCYFEIIARGEKKTYVNLFIENINVSEYLISNGFAQHMEVIESGVNCFVSHINNLSDFYMQLESCSKGLDLMESLLSKYEAFPEINESNYKDGMICAAIFPEDGNWYRAKILSKTSGGYEVLYIDYGNTASTDQIRKLPDNIVGLPFLAKKCSLRLPSDYKSWSEEAESKFAEIAAFGQTIFVVEMKEPGEHVTIDLFVKSKNIFQDLEPLCEKKPPGTEDLNVSVNTSIHLSINEPDFSQPIEAIISHANAPYDFYIQLSSSLAKIDHINNMIAELPIQRIEIPVLGTVCGAYFAEYDTYYRGLINRCTEDGSYSIFFIDYGNEVLAPKDHLIVLPAEIRNIDPLAIKCSLENDKCFRENNESIPKFHKMMEDYDRVIIKIVDKDQKPWIIKVFGNEENLCEKLNNALGNKSPAPIVSHHEKLFIVSYLESSKEFYIQNEEQKKLSDDIIDQLNDNPDALENLKDPKIGDICVAFFDEDSTFYRAKIVEILENGKYNVHYIDFGNFAVSDRLKVTPKDIAEHPNCCHKCWVDDIKDETQFSNTMDKYFGQKFKIEILEASDNQWKIDILINGFNIAEELKRSKESETVEATNNLVDSFKRCRMLDEMPTSPNDFFVAFIEDDNNLDNITKMLLVSESFDKLESPKVGDFCIAKFNQDGLYYRAQVIIVNENGVEVLFIDYGNTDLTDDLRVIPENDILKNFSTRAKHCALENLSEVDFWSDEATSIFNNIIKEAHIHETFQVEILQTNTDPWIVRLFVNNNDVSKELVRKMKEPKDLDITVSIVDEVVREITELDEENSLILHSKDIAMDIIDNIHCSSGHGSMDVTPT